MAAKQIAFLGLLIDPESLSISLWPLKAQQFVKICRKVGDTIVTPLRGGENTG